AGIDYVLDVSLFYKDGFDGFFQRPGPNLFYFILTTVETQSIDFLRAGKTANEHWNVVLFALGVVNLIKIKRPPLFFPQTAELPAHQRVHLGVFIDGPRDAVQKSRAVQSIDIFLKIFVVRHSSLLTI